MSALLYSVHSKRVLPEVCDHVKIPNSPKTVLKNAHFVEI